MSCNFTYISRKLNDIPLNTKKCFNKKYISKKNISIHLIFIKQLRIKQNKSTP